MNQTINTITEMDVFGQVLFPSPTLPITRNTVKVIMFKRHEVAFIYNPVTNIYSFPGGGADTLDLEKEIKRECLEETGCSINQVTCFGNVYEMRNKNSKKYNTTYFTAMYVKHSNKDLRTESEKLHNITLCWIEKNKVLSLLEKQFLLLKENKITFYNSAFNVYRDYFFWKKYMFLN